VWTAGNDEGSETNESINIQTKEGLTVNADVGIQFRIDPTQANELFQMYRKGIDEITD
jgi:regulator of protease activity HflC (stomatin/prohibitin superfamily)